MSIIGPLPYTLQNGTTADASQVQANLDAIRNNVNANAQPSGGGSQTYTGAVVSIASSYSVPDGTGAFIDFDTTLVDTSSIFDGTSKLTVPSGATIVRLLAQIDLNPAPSTGIVALYIIKNTSTNAARTDLNIISVGGEHRIINQIITPAIPVTPGDYFRVFIGTSAAMSGAYIQSADTVSRFEMQVLG